VVSATQFHVRVNRDLEFSYQDVSPYYAATVEGVDLTQRLNKTWDVVGKAEWQTLAYRQLAFVTDGIRTDVGRGYALGAGYRLGDTIRLGLDVGYSMRRSVETARQYDGLRVGASVSYGLTP